MNRKIFNPSGYSVMGFCRNKPLRKILATWCAFATLATTSAPALAATTYTAFDNSVLNNVSGNVYVTDAGSGSSSVTTINVGLTGGASTDVGVLDWGKLNVPGGTTMNFGDTTVDPSITVGGGTFYNIVGSGAGATTIAGALNGANSANVWIFNPDGIAINNGAAVNVGGIFGLMAAGVNNTPRATRWYRDRADARRHNCCWYCDDT